ncbi:hypothetical protein X801_09760, partial [Opisthorchis viverrini]
VIDQPTQRVVVSGLGPYSTRTQCNNCHSQVNTVLKYTSGSLTWILCVLIALLGGWLGCFMIPFCVHGCQDVVHECPQCFQRIGIYKRL